MLKISSNKLSMLFELPTQKDWGMHIKIRFVDLLWMIQKKKQIYIQQIKVDVNRVLFLGYWHS